MGGLFCLSFVSQSGLVNSDGVEDNSAEAESPAPTDAAKALLQDQLSSMGFTQGQVTAALDDLAEMRGSDIEQVSYETNEQQKHLYNHILPCRTRAQAAI